MVKLINKDAFEDALNRAGFSADEWAVFGEWGLPLAALAQLESAFNPEATVDPPGTAKGLWQGTDKTPAVASPVFEDHLPMARYIMDKNPLLLTNFMVGRMIHFLPALATHSNLLSDVDWVPALKYTGLHGRGYLTDYEEGGFVRHWHNQLLSESERGLGYNMRELLEIFNFGLRKVGLEIEEPGWRTLDVGTRLPLTVLDFSRPDKYTYEPGFELKSLPRTYRHLAKDTLTASRDVARLPKSAVRPNLVVMGDTVVHADTWLREMSEVVSDLQVFSTTEIANVGNKELRKRFLPSITSALYDQFRPPEGVSEGTRSQKMASNARRRFVTQSLAWYVRKGERVPTALLDREKQSSIELNDRAIGVAAVYAIHNESHAGIIRQLLRHGIGTWPGKGDIQAIYRGVPFPYSFAVYPMTDQGARVAIGGSGKVPRRVVTELAPLAAAMKKWAREKLIFPGF
jgi:hypothetical protein